MTQSAFIRIQAQKFQKKKLYSASLPVYKGPFINYLKASRGEELKKSLHTLTLRGGGRDQINSYVIFSKPIFYIRNRAVKWFSGDHISFI